MYKLFIQYGNGTQLNKSLEESELRDIFAKGVKGYIKWAYVTTPSGVRKEVTNRLRKS